ncbi:MAG: toll/interleukin-1 receptor domain-containing protein [Leptolyngbya sp. SIO4C1]|nr:toll/interleukin-1 receptor domain-containing protein [Leptolyngbya sp. SIO4C1]
MLSPLAMDKKVGLFISWSGEVSKRIAGILKDWLYNVFTEAELDIFFSSDDIDAGKRWSSDLAERLQESDVGIFLYTQKNLDSLWMAFEAGALSKHIDTGRVIPLLFGARVTDLKGPVSQFQGRRFTKDEMLKTLAAINSCLSNQKTEKDLERNLGFSWNYLNEKIQLILEEEQRQVEGEETRDVGEVLDNMYSLIRTSPLYSTSFAKEISELLQEVKSSHEDVSDLIEQVKKTLRGSYLFIDGEKQAFAALIAATMRARREIRSTRFSPMAISGNKNEYGQAIRARVIGTSEIKPVQRYIRIIAANIPEKMRDIETYLEEFPGKNFELYLTRNSHSFEMVIIDEEEVFIHFYGEGQVIDSTLNIVGPEVTKNFINVYNQLHDPNYSDVLKLEFKYMKRNEVDKFRHEIKDFFEMS